ncbi:2-phosphosulfolactate phosphatase [Thalassoporum mexicanum PCC 7367]|uniref:2-phosphosulfolactate phosphatase family protein n=1 Tax=Thalassoporum mexicanum TaxID=3457544 RepID=UPI00029FC4C7|nr:2-phosphosulfolactate phosphatase [Pseudanabaena sp. PCC 7367]
MKLYTYHTPELTPDGQLPECAIVVDILRATTTIVTALAAGAEAVEVFADLDKLKSRSAEHPPELCLRAAERGGAPVAGFDLGNSPLDYTAERVSQKRIFMSTTNGTRAFQRVQAAPQVIAAAMLNLAAVVNYLSETNPAEVWIVGSGWEGTYSLEDTACAGAIAHEIKTALGDKCEWGNDESLAAACLYQQWRDRLEELFKEATHGQRLLKLDRHADIAYCASIDTHKVLPIQTSPGVLAVAPQHH